MIDWRHPLCTIEAAIARFRRPAPPTAEALRRHAEADASEADRYTDPVSGRSVHTAGALTRLGACCGLECRHCPYPEGARR